MKLCGYFFLYLFCLKVWPVSRYPREHTCVWSFPGLLERIRLLVVFVFENPVCYSRYVHLPSTVIFSRSTSAARGEYIKCEWKRRINTRAISDGIRTSKAARPRFGAWLAVDLANNRPTFPTAFRMLCFLGIDPPTNLQCAKH